jgi:hypothetical protein
LALISWSIYSDFGHRRSSYVSLVGGKAFKWFLVCSCPTVQYKEWGGRPGRIVFAWRGAGLNRLSPSRSAAPSRISIRFHIRSHQVLPFVNKNDKNQIFKETLAMRTKTVHIADIAAVRDSFAPA